MSFWRDMKNLSAVPVPKSAAVNGMTVRQRKARAVRRLAAIADWATTAQISTATGSMAVHSDIAALRANGVAVLAERVPGYHGRCVYRYRAEKQEAT
jgi:hypothetical protein